MADSLSPQASFQKAAATTKRTLTYLAVEIAPEKPGTRKAMFPLNEEDVTLIFLKAFRKRRLMIKYIDIFLKKERHKTHGRNMTAYPKTGLDKFKEAARGLETDDEARFDEHMKKRVQK